MKSIFLIDYKDLNKELKEIIREDLNINEYNARDKLRDLFFNRIMKLEKLNFIIDKTSQYQNEYSEVLDFENDKQVFYNATEILINIFNYERDIIWSENWELVMDLVIRNDIQQILEDDIPNLIKISEKIESKNNYRVNITSIVETIVSLFETVDFDKINKDKFFNKINKEISIFLNDKEIEKLFL